MSFIFFLMCQRFSDSNVSHPWRITVVAICIAWNNTCDHDVLKSREISAVPRVNYIKLLCVVEVNWRRSTQLKLSVWDTSRHFQFTYHGCKYWSYRDRLSRICTMYNILICTQFQMLQSHIKVRCPVRLKTYTEISCLYMIKQQFTRINRHS